MKLYEITAVMRALLDTVSDRPLTADDDPDSEHTQALLAFESAAADMSAKLHSVIAFALELDADITARKAAIDRMVKANDRDEKKAIWLRDYAQSSIEASHMPMPQRYTEFTINLVKLPRTAEIVDPEQVPADYKTQVVYDPEWKIDKKKINEDARDGVVIPGARLLPQAYRLAIK